MAKKRWVFEKALPGNRGKRVGATVQRGLRGNQGTLNHFLEERLGNWGKKERQRSFRVPGGSWGKKGRQRSFLVPGESWGKKGIELRGIAVGSPAWLEIPMLQVPDPENPLVHL